MEKKVGNSRVTNPMGMYVIVFTCQRCAPNFRNTFWSSTLQLGSVAGPVIQASGRLEFEDG